jgi:hypothetical protein
MKHRKTLIALIGFTALTTGIAVSQTTRPGTTPMKSTDGISHIPATVTGGHETDPRDHGRPVVLVAGGLGVTPEVFRKAFSGVTPARGRGPTGDEARRNKAALLKVLAPYGITNDRLDEVSNRYRYRPESGELWTHTEARITADVKNGKIIGFTITSPGAGYTTPPTIEVPGFAGAKVESKITFATDLEKNGSISQVKLAGN